jgi:hypothetical protein
METRPISIERQLEVYKGFYQEELRKRTEAEKCIKDLEKLVGDYQEMLYKESAQHFEEQKEEARKHSERYDKAVEATEKYTREKTIREVRSYLVLIFLSVTIFAGTVGNDGHGFQDFMNHLAYRNGIWATCIGLIYTVYAVVEFLRRK